MPDDPRQAPPGMSHAQLQNFPVDTSAMSTAYTNFVKVMGTPEELFLDFGLNTQSTPNPLDAVRISHRIVLNYYTAKRLLGTLHMIVQQHEQAFGILELDIQKRVKAQVPR